MRKSKYIDYVDTFVTCFVDDSKLLYVYVTDNGHTKAVNWDDNFFYCEYLAECYFEMLLTSFKGWRNKELTKDDWEEIREHVFAYVKHLERVNPDFDRELFSDELKELFNHLTRKEREQLQREYKRRWHYLTKLKEGGKAWTRETQRLEQIKNILM